MKATYLLAVASAAVMAKPMKLSKDSMVVHNLEQRHSITQMELDNFRIYSEYTAAAYCNVGRKPGDRIKCGGGTTCAGVEANNATISSTFVGRLTGAGAIIALDHTRREIILAFRGSDNIRNWITNFVFAREDCDLVANCKVHSGFRKAWQEIADATTHGLEAATRACSSSSSSPHGNDDYKVVIAGYSLGGAVATLAAAHLRRAGLVADVFTFGSPRVGNDAFANFVTSQPGGRSWRVTHRDDPVPRLGPMFLGYRHISPEYWLAGGGVDQTDYPVGAVRRCDGIANTECNAGTFGLNIFSHLYYLTHMIGCAKFPQPWKRDSQGVSDEELEQRLTLWSQWDQNLVKGA
ncbi:hypothetical protein JDV02_005818 [Purpureocillium takamizusanense]|uniref:Fungal lipase-type domain-containing protein n=1 Tax=Purpureocillium takamizusanense TaxID=2060973 RepID=A0A9Q8QGW5_9HYPO|nr:uncharacterized protein JDV02_005818 [Purpureocillium takamizusanense]UNI19643.1 hypothetical protein JDV02_005818 [Purpureocillium takamizusanense]